MKKNKAFTLIELMIVVAIVAILATVAVPSYQQYVMAGKRAEGTAFALDIASRQERHYSQFSRYAAGLTGGGDTNLTMDSDDSENDEYTGSITLGTGNTSYTITVTPSFTDSVCGALTIDNLGVRGEGGSGTVDDCWR